MSFFSPLISTARHHSDSNSEEQALLTRFMAPKSTRRKDFCQLGSFCGSILKSSNWLNDQGPRRRGTPAVTEWLQ